VTLVDVIPGVLGRTEYHYRCSFDPYVFVESIDEKARR
jgi:hypothetical protein